MKEEEGTPTATQYGRIMKEEVGGKEGGRKRDRLSLLFINLNFKAENVILTSLF